MPDGPTLGGTSRRLRLGVLDQSPVPAGSTGQAALRATVELARAVESLGYARIWLAEHHSAPGLAGTAPEVLAAAVASATSTIRVGAGGVLLSHYSPLKVAEAFRVLSALFPGRIELGVGRASGARSVVAAALQPGPEAFGDEYFPRQVVDLLGYLEGGLESGHPHAGTRAMPEGPDGPPVWLLGSSPYSAGLAASLGLSFCFAHFITPAHGPQVMAQYRRSFRPAEPPRPTARAVAVSVVCAPTDAEAERLAASQAVWHLQSFEEREPVPDPDEAAAAIAALDPLGRARMAQERNRVVVGGPERVRSQLTALADAFGVDEVVIVTICHDTGARLRSYELLAEALELRADEGG
jgi:luciferase family oxidoreductase group 1